jgi:hypothetical protein
MGLNAWNFPCGTMMFSDICYRMCSNISGLAQFGSVLAHLADGSKTPGINSGFSQNPYWGLTIK